MAALCPLRMLRLAVLMPVALCTVLSSEVFAGQSPAGMASSSFPSRMAARPIPASYGKLPLSFEANRGQAGKNARFLAHGAGFSLALTPTEAVFTLQSTAKAPEPDLSRLTRHPLVASHPIRPDIIRMRLAGARATCAIQGQSPLPGKINYFLGKDPKQWRTDIPTYAKVRYRGVYPGVDLVYYGNQRQLEYDFVVAPKADPSQIALKFEGAKQLRVEKDGELVVGLKSGSVRWHKPVVYQEIGGKRKTIAGCYVLKGADRVTFAVARYDSRHPLVIDPVLAYSTFLGGWFNDEATAIALDHDGNAYIAGTTNSYGTDPSVDFPGTPNPTNSGIYAFVSKINPTGSTLLYSSIIGVGDAAGAIPQTEARGITVDGGGQAYVVGHTFNENFPDVKGLQLPLSGLDAFLMKINASGNRILYSTRLGGSGSDHAQAVALHPDGTVYIAGYTNSSDFPTVKPFQSALNGDHDDAFVARIDTTLSGRAALLYSSYLGGNEYDQANGIAVDLIGRIYITGVTSSDNFPIVSAYQPKRQGSNDANIFVTCFSPDGSRILYSTYLAPGSAAGIAVDNAQHAFVVGTAYLTIFPVYLYYLPVRNAVQSTSGGFTTTAFAAEFDCSAIGDRSLVYSTFLGGNGSSAASGVAVDVWGNSYVTGSTLDAAATDPKAAYYSTRIFVAKIKAGGGRLLFASTFGGARDAFEDDSGNSIAVDLSGYAYVAGSAQSRNFPVTPGAFQTHHGNEVSTPDAFALRMPTFARLDFDGDMQPDFLFQNAASGELICWLLDGHREKAAAYLTPRKPGTNWAVAATADLNGDNSTDLLFQNSQTGDLAYWLMDGTTATSIGYLSPKNPGVHWSVVGIADINRDGYPDIVFQNSVNGDLYVWYMQGTARITGRYLNPRNPGVGWKVVAVGDLNNDGQADILFQNVLNGKLCVWYMHADTLIAGGYLNPADPGIGWNVAGLADINGDGRPEILFQNASTGQMAYWVMNGPNLASVGFPNPAFPGGTGWKLAGAH